MSDFETRISIFKDSTVGTQIVFTARIKDYMTATTTAGKPYISGTLADTDITMPFKVWDAAVVKQFMDENVQGQICLLTGMVKEYKGTREVHVSSVALADTPDMSAYMRSADVNSLCGEFSERLQKLPLEWQQAWQQVFSCVPDAWNKFAYGYAAKSYHDAQRGGLIHHTVKMLRLLDTVLANEPRLENFRNILTLGIMIHDIGKIEEIVEGVYQPDSFINHRMKGFGYLMQRKDAIVQLIGIDNFNHLCSVVLEHHGGIEAEPMHTVYALIVYMIDNCDAQCTYIADGIDDVNGNVYITGAGNRAVKYENRPLVY